MPWICKGATRHAPLPVLLVLLLLYHCAIVAGSDQAPVSRARQTRLIFQRSAACRATSGPCVGARDSGDEACVPRCVSPRCFDTVYGTEPLEDGEIDVVRAALYNRCVGKEMRESKRGGAGVEAWTPVLERQEKRVVDAAFGEDAVNDGVDEVEL
jgi:hypothetical protein